MTTAIIGHTDVHQRLHNAVSSPRLPHAWLLHGAKGIGKQLLAHDMARTFLCTERDSQSDACGSCHSCHMMAADNHPDFRSLLLEEGKRDIPVAAIRKLLGFLALSGNESSHRVALIDDADRLNNAAANALLKGLEEPAAGCLLILVAHDLQRLPATVRSRCILQSCAALDEASMRTVLAGMELDPETAALALNIGHGQPGRIACLRQQQWAELLKAWQQSIDDLRQTDLSRIQQLLAGKWPTEVFHLAVDILLDRLYMEIANLPSPQNEDALQLAWQLAELPKRIELQKLAPDMALLGFLLQLRRLLRANNDQPIAKIHSRD
ncbi:MAG: DNA polymerase III subunit delta' [Mariprofundales bacterium]